MYTASTYQSNFETWFNSAADGVYIGTFHAGWVAMVIGFKSGGYGVFTQLSYGESKQSFIAFCTVYAGTFYW